MSSAKVRSLADLQGLRRALRAAEREAAVAAARAQAEIERLQRLLKRLEEQVNEGLAVAGGPNLPEPPPPHY